MTEKELAMIIIRDVINEVHEADKLMRNIPWKPTVVMTKATKGILERESIRQGIMFATGRTVPYICGCPVKVVPGSKIRVWVSVSSLAYDRPEDYP